MTALIVSFIPTTPLAHTREINDVLTEGDSARGYTVRFNEEGTLVMVKIPMSLAAVCIDDSRMKAEALKAIGTTTIAVIPNSGTILLVAGFHEARQLTMGMVFKLQHGV